MGGRVKKVIARHSACLPCLGTWEGEEGEEGRGGLSSYELGFHISSMAHDSYNLKYVLGFYHVLVETREEEGPTAHYVSERVWQNVGWVVQAPIT